VAARDAVLISLGKRVRFLREQRGVSQEGLAEVSKLHRTYIGGIERGLRNPSVKSLDRIAKGLGVEIALLFK
jgi:transcriptional regulator with XRE-family HTH domain